MTDRKFQYDICIIGGGILGCMAARELSRYSIKVLLAEKQEDVCCGITKANSAIIYAGYDHKPGTLKSRLCLKGNRQMDQLCEELEVTMHRCGSIMVGFGPKSEEVIRKKYDQGLQNEVPELELLSGAEICAMEPGLNPDITMGLLSGTTGTVNPWELGIAAFENSMENGCEVSLHTEVCGISKIPGGFELEMRNHRTGICETISAKGILNCAGMHADHVRELLQTPGVRIHPNKGIYLVFDSLMEKKPEHIIFYEPEKKGKGLTLVPTTDGSLLAAGTEEDAFSADDMVTSSTGLQEVRRKVEFLYPEMDFSCLINSFAAIRPNPYDTMEEGKSIHSFVIDQSAEYPEMVSLIGVKTPGLTCSAALAEYAVKKLFDGMKWIPEKKADFHPFRRISHRLQAAASDKTGDRIICHCNQVTEYEIREAIRRGAVNAEGIKHRCSTGMGKCQGTRCREKIRKILSESQEISITALDE